MIELVAPAGDMEKLKTALYFGADAVYLAAKNYGLRAFAANFEYDALKEAIELCHAAGKKVYVTLNIFARSHDFGGLREYLEFLSGIKPDGVIVSDAGVLSFIKKYAPKLKIHLSTQANTTNKYSAAFWADFVERIVLARELSLEEIAEIHEFLPDLQLEAFVHGAMCMSYSGRCLLSDFFTGRAGNRGECVQACRWQYTYGGEGGEIAVEEDARGSYIMNSADLNMLAHLDKLAAAGISAFKIEGRAKSPYYVAGAVGAYRRGIDILKKGGEYICPLELLEDLDKIGNRTYSTGFYFGRAKQFYDSSKPQKSYDFAAIVVESAEGGAIIEQRNRFKVGDILEVLSPSPFNGAQIKIDVMRDGDGQPVYDALNVQQRLFIPFCELAPGDILRKRIN